MELYQMSAVELSRLLTARECSAVDIIESLFSRIDQMEGTLGAYITQTRELARKQAAAVDDKISHGELVGPLAGIPLALKDNICTRGIRTTCASKMLSDFIPPYDAAVMSRLATAGTVLLGKTNMDEFAMGSSCETSYFHLTKNPWDVGRIPGGSSGGSAAAVASGEAVLALGSDTGGSVRLPAAYCGVVGLRPTYGSVSRSGLVAFASSLDQIGPIGRTVADTALLYSAICGWDPMDATSVKRVYPEFEMSPHPSIKGTTIGIPTEYLGGEIHKEAREAVLRAALLLEKNGAVLRKVSLPGTGNALAAYYILSSAEASSNLARYDGVRYGYRAKGTSTLDELYEKSRSEGFGKEVKRRILLGTFVLSSGYFDEFYQRAKREQQRIRAEFSEAFQECDLLLTPTAIGPAFPLEEQLYDPPRMYGNDRCTVPASLAGLPAISLPCGRSSENLPLGIQMIGPAFSEPELLIAAASYEELSGGFSRPVPEVV